MGRWKREPEARARSSCSVSSRSVKHILILSTGDVDVDVGFVKLFLSTSQLDMRHIPQSSPFKEVELEPEMDLALMDLALEPRHDKQTTRQPKHASWDTILVKIVQKRPIQAPGT